MSLPRTPWTNSSAGSSGRSGPAQGQPLPPSLLPHRPAGKPGGDNDGLRRHVYIGEVVTSSVPSILQTLLGSCVAACLYDPVVRIGGMNHILLPFGAPQDHSARFGVHAMERLINALMREGADRRRLVAKAFGGASVLPKTGQTPAVGASNAAFVRSFFALERIPLVAERLGGRQATRVCFHTHTGKATVHSVNGAGLARLAREENTMSKTPLDVQPAEDSVTLF